jgi:hypothetical protein
MSRWYGPLLLLPAVTWERCDVGVVLLPLLLKHIMVARRKFSQISAIPPRGRQIILETGRQSQQKIQRINSLGLKYIQVRTRNTTRGKPSKRKWTERDIMSSFAPNIVDHYVLPTGERKFLVKWDDRSKQGGKG